MAELERLGVRSVPVLSRGDKYTFGQSTKQIVDFLGLTEKSGPELSTDRAGGARHQVHGCRARADPADAGRPARHPRAGPAAQLPHARLPSVPRRSTPSSTPTRTSPWSRPCSARSLPPMPAPTPWSPMARRCGTASGPGGRPATPRRRRRLQTYYGPQSLHELMERTTWHSGQHVRQYMMLLEKEGVTHHRPLVAADFAKLPMPQNVWDG